MTQGGPALGDRALELARAPGRGQIVAHALGNIGPIELHGRRTAGTREARAESGDRAERAGLDDEVARPT